MRTQCAQKERGVERMATIWLSVANIFGFFGLMLGLVLYLFGQTTAAMVFFGIGMLPAVLGITVALVAVMVLGIVSSVVDLVQAIRG